MQFSPRASRRCSSIRSQFAILDGVLTAIGCRASSLCALQNLTAATDCTAVGVVNGTVGVGCDVNGGVRALYIVSFTPLATSLLPSTIALLTSMTGFVMQNVKLPNSTIPTELYTLTNLVQLCVAERARVMLRTAVQLTLCVCARARGGMHARSVLVGLSLTGVVSTRAWRARARRPLHRMRSYADACDAVIGRLHLLFDLRLSGNALSGSLPTQLGLLTSLRGFTAAGNKLSGAVPPLHITSPYQNFSGIYTCALVGVPMSSVPINNGNCFSDIGTNPLCYNAALQPIVGPYCYWYVRCFTSALRIALLFSAQRCAVSRVPQSVRQL